VYEAFYENNVLEYKTHIYITAENRKRHMMFVIWKNLRTVPEILTCNYDTPFISMDVGREFV